MTRCTQLVTTVVPRLAGSTRPWVGALLCAVLLLGPLSGLVGHDHAASDWSAESCVAEHHAGPEDGHTDAPHLRAGVDHEHDCDVCQHHRVRDGALLRSWSAVAPTQASVHDTCSAAAARRVFTWQWQARGPPASDLNRLS